MDFKKITEEAVQEANTYVPLMDKVAFVEYAAERCFDRLNVTMKDDVLDLPMAPMYKENTQLKSRYLMGALLTLYLRQAYEPVEGDMWLMSADDYDRWAGGHIFNRLERMKAGSPALRDKVFELLADYRDLEKRLNSEVRSLLQVMNDPVVRIMGTMQAQTTPEAFQAGKEKLEELTRELEEYKAGKAREMESRAARKEEGEHGEGS